MAVAGITALLPGLTTYRAVLELTVYDDAGGHGDGPAHG
jgi:uncharacterized membrane protein YjjB (DUF3815 family)